MPVSNEEHKTMNHKEIRMNANDAKTEGSLIFRATVTDTISHERVHRYTFSADSIEEARELAWKRAGKYGGDVFVKIERLSK
jgi:hypothetical protein